MERSLSAVLLVLRHKFSSLRRDEHCDCCLLHKRVQRAKDHLFLSANQQNCSIAIVDNWLTSANPITRVGVDIRSENSSARQRMASKLRVDSTRLRQLPTNTEQQPITYRVARHPRQSTIPRSSSHRRPRRPAFDGQDNLNKGEQRSPSQLSRHPSPIRRSRLSSSRPLARPRRFPTPPHRRAAELAVQSSESRAAALSAALRF